MNSARKVKVEAEVTTVSGTEPYFICKLFRNGKKVHECVKADKTHIVEKTLRGYEGKILPCEFEVALRPEVSR